MDHKETIDQLRNLIQLDIDAAHAYRQAIGNTEDAAVSSTLEKFLGDHERHVAEMSSILRGFGVEPPEYSPDFKGYLIQGFTYLRSATGTEGSLRAMYTNEKLTNKSYADAVKMSWTADILSVIERNFADERNHISWIEAAINRRVWEGKRPGAAPGTGITPGA